MKTIHLGEGKTCPLDIDKLVSSRLLIQANAGGGKSHTIRRLLEQTHGKVQQIVLDPEGEFSTLREKFDYVLAGKGGDVPAEPRSAALLARKLLETGASAIVDLYELHPQERKHFVRLFLDAMTNAPKDLWHQCLVVIDEAHVFCPEAGQAESASAVIDLASRGRKRGYCAVLATQRISKLHKDAAAECNNKLIGRTSLDIDMKRAGDELGFRTHDQLLQLRQLDPGQFWAYGPAMSKEVTAVLIGPVETSHPQIGSARAAKVSKPSTAIKGILAKLGDLPKEAEAEARTADDLRKEISELKRHRCPKVQEDPLELDRAIKAALAQQAKAFDAERRIRAAERQKLERLLTSGVELLTAPLPISIPSVNVPDLPRQVKTVVTVKAAPAVEYMPSVDVDPSAISRTAQRIAVIVSAFPGISRTRLAVKSCLSQRSSNYSNMLSELRAAGLIRGEAGVFFASPDVPLSWGDAPTVNEVHEGWRRKLSGSAVRIMDFLLGRSDVMTRTGLAEAVGLSPTSSNYSNMLSELRSNGLVSDVPGGIVISKDLTE